MSDLMKCPLPCGWSSLQKNIIRKAAYFARATLTDEIPENVRQVGIELGKYALQLAQSRHIPEGYILIPIEPDKSYFERLTEEQYKICQQKNYHTSEQLTWQEDYKAMLAAAQGGEK